MTNWFLGLALAISPTAAPTPSNANTPNDWPRFHGPNGTGIAGSSVPLDVGDKNNLLWKVPVPGKGWSSPIVVKGKVFLQTSTEDKRLLLCINAADGKTLWSRELPGKTGHTHKKNSMASGTPACDGEAVYCVVWDGDAISLQAFDMAGKPLWNSPIGTFTSQHGPGHSPVVFGGLVFVNYDQDGGAELDAFDAKTGAKKWVAPRKPERACYATPFILERPGKPAELVVATTHQITGYEPASGKVVWDYTVNWPSGKMPMRSIAAPAVAGNLIVCFFGDGSGSRLTIALDTSKSPNPTKVWEATKDTPYVPCPVVRGDYLYWINDGAKGGMGVCAEVKTGKIVWMERVFSKDISASLVLVGDEIFAIGEDGQTAVLKASPEFEDAKKAPLGQPTHSSPAVADGKLIIRGSTDLFCFGKK